MFQLVIVVIIPIFVGMVYVPPFELPEEQPVIEIPDEPSAEIPNLDILYFILMVIWLFFLIRILFQIKKGTFSLQRKF